MNYSEEWLTEQVSKKLNWQKTGKQGILSLFNLLYLRIDEFPDESDKKAGKQNVHRLQHENRKYQADKEISFCSISFLRLISAYRILPRAVLMLTLVCSAISLKLISA